MNEKERTAVWEEYIKTRSPKLREKLIIEYVPLVKVVAGRMGMYLGYTVEYDDLTGYGIFGLIDAIDKFELTKGVKFETYASLRIRGSILFNNATFYEGAVACCDAKVRTKDSLLSTFIIKQFSLRIQKSPEKSSLVIGAAKDHLPLSFPRVNSNSFLLFKNAFCRCEGAADKQGRD